MLSLGSFIDVSDVGTAAADAELCVGALSRSPDDCIEDVFGTGITGCSTGGGFFEISLVYEDLINRKGF